MIDYVQIARGFDLINTLLELDLCIAIDILNRHKYRGFDCWVWDKNLRAVRVNRADILLINSYYYTMSESEAILTARGLER